MMREFIGSDGRVWRARLDEQAAGGAAWELVLFEADGSQVTQRIVFRPVGWLRNAQLAELVSALGEAEAVRTRWGE